MQFFLVKLIQAKRFYKRKKFANLSEAYTKIIIQLYEIFTHRTNGGKNI